MRIVGDSACKVPSMCPRHTVDTQQRGLVWAPLQKGGLVEVGDQVGPQLSAEALGLAWPALAVKVRVSDKWGQSILCPVCPALFCPVPRPGSLQVSTQ